MATVYLVEDNKNTLRILEKILSSIDDVQVRAFAQPTLALLASQKEKPDLIVTDMMMPVMNGIEMVRSMRKDGVECPVVFISAYPQLTFEQLLPDNRVSCVVDKTAGVLAIRREVETALRSRDPQADIGTRILRKSDLERV